MFSIMNIVGARPNFMKIAPLVHEMRARPEVSAQIVHTGQHYDDKLSKVFFDELDIPRPDVNLGVGSGSREAQIAKIATVFEPVLEQMRPDLLLVVGDVNSTIACAGVARRHGIPVAHVEAGLRSFDMEMPEEHNRLETDRISDFLFVTEPSGVSNLERESVPGKVYFVGNVMIDNLVANLGRADSSTVLDELHLTPGSYFTGTFHRPSNVDALDNLRHLLTIMRTVCRHAPYVLPMHPRTRHSFERNGLLEELNRIEGLILVEPLGYLDFLQLMRNARGLVTDSGGIQEETTYLGIPCLTMRRNTERPVTIDVGTNTLLGDDISALEREIDNIMHGRYKSGQRPDLWDGHAATRIVDILVRALERRPGTHAGHGARRATA